MAGLLRGAGNACLGIHGLMVGARGRGWRVGTKGRGLGPGAEGGTVRAGAKGRGLRARKRPSSGLHSMGMTSCWDGPCG